MKILLRPICWIFGHKHYEEVILTKGKITYFHSDLDNCMRCGKHTPQKIYFSNAVENTKEFGEWLEKQSEQIEKFQPKILNRIAKNAKKLDN